MPYINPLYRYKQMPTGRQLFSGLKRTISSYWQMYTTEEMVTCIADGYPVVGGVAVYDSFQSDAIARTGIIPMPSSSEKFKGGHAIVFCGYDMMSKRFIFRNSWGTKWGQEGYGTIPFEYVDQMGWDFWTVRK